MPAASAFGSARWNPWAAVRAAFATRLGEWMRRRQGEDHLPVALERRRLYILPTRGGLAFTALLFLMMLAGLNYANSLALFFTFLLTGFALVVMQQCHRNLLGTEVIAAVAPAVFARSTGAVQLTLANSSAAARPLLEAALRAGTLVSADLPAGTQRRIELPLAAPARGVVRIERVRLSTAWPFGLFRVWTWVHTPVTLLVYPHPHGALPIPAHSARAAGARSQLGAGADEWVGLRPFRDGDSPRQVDWKAYAREAPLLVKEYVQGASELRMFEYAQLAHLDQEARLSQLARWVVDAEAQGERYGLILPKLRLAADRGPEHRHRCLAALALFGLEDTAR
ncbi:MAG: DUF58 domain-containing protein [Gammaproteobacteria bacterium]|nr:DUF58 domain-containing protein [Gammaproteobacteria bacterium]